LGRRHVVLLPVALLSPPRTAPAQAEPITIFAAASLEDAFTEAGVVVAQRRPGFEARFNFAGSQQLALQIDQGAGADLFAAADDRSIRTVGEKGLLADTAVIFARNRLVVIVPAANPGRVDRLSDLAKTGLKLVLAAAAVPVGLYSREALDRMAGAGEFGPDFAARVLRNVVSQEDNVKAVVAKVRLGEADAGIVYVSDVTAPVRRVVRQLAIPDPYNPIAAYPVAVLVRSTHKPAARAFVDFLLSDEGQQLLERHGLLPAAP
jgi:molybdate transport system substrate-binding protein